MQLEEKRRAIEAQKKKKMETLSARQRLKLGKAAFLHAVKKGNRPGWLRQGEPACRRAPEEQGQPHRGGPLRPEGP
uniref:Uncharacterized protein n=1 Tax=Equus asinus TaxID=9793 RepID=A0A8C4LSA9_EQUAS